MGRLLIFLALSSGPAFGIADSIGKSPLMCQDGWVMVTVANVHSGETKKCAQVGDLVDPRAE